MSRAKMLMAAMVGVLALSGLASAVASAEPAGWMVNGTMLGQTAALATTAFVDEKGELTAGQVEVFCKGRTLSGVNPRINGLNKMGEADSLEFSECEGNSECPLATSERGKVGTLPVLVDLTLQGALEVKGKFLPTNSSKVFATIKFEGATCSFAGAVQPVRGTQAFLAPTGQDERVLQLLTAVTETSGELQLASTAASLRGSILVQLASGLPFSFL